MVKDIDASVRFYKEVVGLELKGRLDHPNGVIQLAFLGFGQQAETELELIQATMKACRRKAKCITLRLPWTTLKKNLLGLKSLT